MLACMEPDLRVGDRERTAAAERLSAHHAAGRLSVDELERRLERATAAVFAHDLDAVEADLPPLAGDRRWRPSPEAAGALRWRRSPAARAIPLAWPLLPLALIVLGVAASLSAGHPIAPLFIVAAFLLWRRAACA
jgi:hypothetical protein